MQLFVNDLSIHGQFPDIQTFKEAIRRVMTMREIARKFGRQLYCHRNLAYTQVTKDLLMPQAVQHFDKNEQRSVMQWLTRNGPFWEDIREHSPNEYMECNGNVVTDTAIGEAAHCCFYGSLHDLVSLTPSDWDYSPLYINWIRNGDNNRDLTIGNHWSSRPKEPPLWPLTEPYVKLSLHTAPPVHLFINPVGATQWGNQPGFILRARFIRRAACISVFSCLYFAFAQRLRRLSK